MTTAERERRSWVMSLAHVIYRRDKALGFGPALSKAWAARHEIEARDRATLARGKGEPITKPRKRTIRLVETGATPADAMFQGPPIPYTPGATRRRA